MFEGYHKASGVRSARKNYALKRNYLAAQARYGVESLANMPKDFIWTTQDGECFTVEEMTTSHLFYSLRMIFNHTVPGCYQIVGCRQYNGPASWPISYRRRAVVAFVEELKRRGELPAFMQIQLRHMASVTEELIEPSARLTN